MSTQTILFFAPIHILLARKWYLPAFKQHSLLSTYPHIYIYRNTLAENPLHTQNPCHAVIVAQNENIRYIYSINIGLNQHITITLVAHTFRDVGYSQNVNTHIRQILYVCVLRHRSQVATNFHKALSTFMWSQSSSGHI